MNPNDERIDRVLAALRDAVPLENMEQRLHAALHEAAEPEPRSDVWRRLLPSTRTAALAMAMALLCVVPAWVMLHKGAPQQRSDAAVTATGPSPKRGVTRHSDAEEPRVRDITHKAEALSPARHRQAAFTQAEDVTQQASTAGNGGRSFPAPPLPLTTQETLLLRIAHRNDPVQLAMLLPSVREDDFQREKEQVREFFKAPDPPATANVPSNANGVTQ